MNKEREIRRIRDLILRSVHSSLGGEEERELEAWRKASPRNEETFRKLVEQRFSPEEYARYRQVRLSDDWPVVRRKLRKYRAMRFLSWRWVARYAAAVLVGVVALYWLRWQPAEEPRRVVARQEILPGEMKAVLRLESGERIALGANGKRQDERLVVRGISEQDSALVYAAEERRQAERHVLAVPRGGEYVLTLADGTKVWLNSESELRYPSYFGDSERRVSVVGEAYFQVAKDESSPFVVEAGDVAVRVTGTEFNVMAYADADRVETTLARGGVTVEAGGRSERIVPGEQAVYAKATGELSAREVDVALYTSWKDGVFEFRDMPLSSVVRQLERWYDVDIVFADSAVAAFRFTGAVKKAKPLDFILNIIRETQSVDYRIEGREVTISKK